VDIKLITIEKASEGQKGSSTKYVCMLKGIQQKCECSFIGNKNILDITEKI
jgi:hypothetical protein